MLTNAHNSWKKGLPKSINSILFIAGDDDEYVKSKNLKKWVIKQREKYKSEIEAFQCENARHELDNELVKNGSEQVINQSIGFINNELKGSDIDLRKVAGPCKAI